MPPEARQALLAQAGAHEIIEVEVERDADGKPIGYEAAWRADGRIGEAMVTSGGELVELEQVLDPCKVPAAVRATSEKVLVACADVGYERRVIVVYAARGMVDGEMRQVLISPTGRVLGQR